MSSYPESNQRRRQQHMGTREMDMPGDSDLRSEASDIPERYDFEDREKRRSSKSMTSVTSVDNYGADVHGKSDTLTMTQTYAWVRITLDRAEGLRLRENGEKPDVVATVRSLSTIPS
jgi:hypothetical protein